MKDEVIKFLAATPKSRPAQFNEALSLYRRSKNSNPGQVRFMNTLGYSEDRLENLLYELKKLHGITDLQVAQARKPEKPNSQAPNSKGEKSPEEKLLEEVHLLDGVTLQPDADVKLSREYLQELVERLEETGIPDTDKNLEPVIEILKGFEEKLDAFEEEQTKNLEVNDPQEVKADLKESLEKHLSEGGDIADEKGNIVVPKSDESEETEQTGDESAENTEAEAKEATSEEKEATDPDLVAIPEKDIDTPESLLKEKLSDYDVEAHSYNENKSFAADVSDVIKEEPENQKHETLKAFILTAKKKVS